MNYLYIKRLIDITITFTALIVLFPLMVIIGLLIRLSDGGRAIYSQTRIGKSRRPFKIYKFRTMIEDADEILFRNKDLYDQARSGAHKIENDPRVTTFGKFLRKYSLDELPQFFNVLTGEMSFVGPRAYRPDELQKYEDENPGDQTFLNALLSVKPGITGLWQVNGRSTVSFDERVRMEALYSQKISLMVDLLIILKTPWAVIKAKGAS